MENRILNEKDLNGAYAEITTINEQIKNLENKKAEITRMLSQSAINKAKSKFPDIEFGDKVKVVRSVYDWNNPKATETVIRYMGRFDLNRYAYIDYHDYERNVYLELYQLKKDGARSLKKDEMRIDKIISIEKVEE